MSLAITIRRALGERRLEVDLEIADGERLVVIGPNGAGKSSLLRSVAGLDPIDSGRVAFGDEIWDDAATGEHRPVESRRLGVVPQRDALLAHLNVLDNVAYGPRSQGASRREARRRAHRELERFHIGHLADARPRSLSGGEAQRVAIARALVAEPTALLLDEPTSALDLAAKAGVRALLTAATTATARPSLIVTHDAVDALTLGDRIAVLEEGQITQIGTGRELAAAPRTGYVAELLGINLIRGLLNGSTLTSGNFELTVGAHDLPGGEAIATVRPRSISLHRARPEGSPRNVWQSRISSIDRTADRVRVRLVDPVEIVVELTAAGLDAIGVGEGGEVWASVKASEVSVTGG